MTKDIIVRIQGLQFEGNNETPTPVEVINPAEYYYRNNTHYIIYDEISSDFSDSTRNKIKIKDNMLEISKKGTTSVVMNFVPDKKMQTYYQTPYGSLLVALYTHRLKFVEKENELILDVEYELEIDSQPIADCQIKITVTPKEASILSGN